MIARPVHRPHPIPFNTESSASDRAQVSLSLGSSASRAVSWAAALGPGAQAGSMLHMPARLSPVRASMSGSSGTPQASNPASTSRAAASAVANVGGPRPRSNNHGATSMTEPSARYVGHGALSVRSSVTGRHYRFQGHGDSLVIDRSDVVLLKRISDLVIR